MPGFGRHWSRFQRKAPICSKTCVINRVVPERGLFAEYDGLLDFWLFAEYDGLLDFWLFAEYDGILDLLPFAEYDGLLSFLAVL